MSVKNNNEFNVTCYYAVTLTTSMTSWSTKTVGAGESVTLIGDNDIDGYTVHAYFKKPGASNASATISHTLDSSSSTSWSEPD